MILNFELATGSRIFQYLSGVTGNLGIVSSEMHYGWPSPSLPIIYSGNYTFKLTKDEGSWLAVMPLIGAILGAFFTSILVDFFGRKRIIIYSSLPLFAAWLMIGFTTSPVLLFVARFLAGLADGLSFTAVPMYLGEIAEPEIRGLLGSLCPVSVVFGILLINAIGSYMAISTTAFVASSIPLVLLCTFSWMPESPYFLLMRGRYDEARRSLRMLRQKLDVDEELNRLAAAVEEQSENSGKISELFMVRSNRKALLIALGLRTVQQLAGTTAITFYCKTIFSEAEDFLSPSVAVIIFFCIQLVLSAVSSLVVDVSGRRPLLLLSCTGTAVALFVNGTYLYMKKCTDVDVSRFNFVLLVSMVCFVVMFSCGLQTIPLLMMSEIFPTNVKASALCLADIYYSVIATLVTKLFHVTGEAFGMHVPFFTYTVSCLVGLVLIYLYIPETKGKTLEDIQLHLKGKQELTN